MMPLPLKTAAPEPRVLAMMLAGTVMGAVLVDWSHQYWSVAAPQIAAWSLLAVWAAGFLRRPRPFPTPALAWAFLPLAVWGPLQLAFGLTVSRFATLQASLGWAASAAFFWIGAQALASERVREQFLTVMLVFGGVLSLFAVLQYYTAPDLALWMIPSPDCIGPFIYKNHFAAFVELLFPVAVVRILVDRQRALLWGVLAATLFASVVVSASRGGVALLSAELVTVLAIGARRRWIPARRVWLLSLQLPVLFAVLVALFGFQSIWAHFHETSSGDIRKKLLVSTLEMVRERPVPGYGLGTWRSVYPRYARFDNARYANEAHNDWAQWAAEGGLPFALLLAGVALFCARAAWLRPWALGPVAVFAHSLIDYPARDPAVNALLFILVGAAAAAPPAVLKSRALRPLAYSGS